MISVCMASYNGEKYIAEQIKSILANLSVEDELIISDDGSVDGTIDIIQHFSDGDSRIRLISGPGKGVIKNFENAISHAKGDLIFLSDQDDVWNADKVNRVKMCFEDPGVNVVLHNAAIVGSSINDTGMTFFDFRHSRKGLLRNLIKNSYIGCCMAFRRELVPVITPIPGNIEMHDWWIGLIGEITHGTCLLDRTLIDYRRHDNNVSKMYHHPLQKMIRNRIIICNELRKRMYIIKEYKQKRLGIQNAL